MRIPTIAASIGSEPYLGGASRARLIQVLRNSVLCRPDFTGTAMVKRNRSRAQRLDRRHVVTDEEDRPAFSADVVHLAEALPLERGVADGENLVDDEDLRLQVRGDGEAEPHVHAARVALHRRVEELLDLGEVDDLVEPAVDLRAAACPRIAPFR